ncbi:bifunctional riboflavin kinase/FAD synthetase [Corynebacterium sp. 153RC1]|uniref:bifunctional riboflavin kinase/FAD synthetase n=1 Tax=unclassified Corynebacterium TaxID=2624378 RepID=UPI00211CED39|nr:bifunctional riboflavin kinase/FAD synthetase [Corynebacterium sp. 209RC1]MCQ9353964.1 bifunctional riboflavin kinase/FAD synthetase [Corynebacterium sp. 1222RC1]MCQ9355878.1 bifunctional riboflavin kinase/FAD synthetase [Corynebacterium sp. 122RC1]MCQ9358122.1 bifunctional riboflavin kinase/FAD synthetase [Corynebacterium sp. 142RC1]MCQ9360274.1 bifunctional riboflavin kinase/FAD synthetase [Corynebacterium sp. 153RC1]MCQ9362406.1 bifunctional riboflavin kinase/FAD synthetase [Corynebacter
MVDVDIWHGIDEITEDLSASVVTIGVFDGVHRGHRTLIHAATTRAKELGVPSVLLTFNPHPLAVLRPQHMPPMLGTVGQRADFAVGLGIDHMLALNFTADLARLSPEEFFTTVLMDTLHAQTVVVGENFTFGHKAAGTTETLRELGQRYGVEVQVLELLAEDGTVLSSSMIRAALLEGNVERANWALGRNFSICGQVVRGAGRGGRELGYPTANLYFPDTQALPEDGVYAGWFRVISQAPIDGDMLHGQNYPAAISVGHNPTFGDERRSVESYVIGQHADLYGHTVEVEFVHRVRGMEKFDSLDELLQAISKDIDVTCEVLGVNPAHRGGAAHHQ